jgi:hypothetical protein
VKEDAMKRINGGTKVKAGFYWRAGRWEIVPVEGSGSVLPGDASESYWPIPTLGMLMAAPVMGALFVVFLPFIGFAIVARQLAHLPVFEKKPATGAVKAGSHRA